MKISVIIPTYNRVHTLRRALDSVLNQKGIDDLELYEVIVVDDASTDDTVGMVEASYPQCTMISLSGNKGVSHARNVGFQRANGDWLAWLDSDDEWLPDKIYRQRTLLQQSGLLFCHTEEIWIRNGVRVNAMKKHRKTGGWIFSHCLPLCAISPSSVLMHRSILDDVGCFDENLPVCEDYDLWLRVTANYEVAFLEEPAITKYGGHADQLSRSQWGMDRFRVTALEKILSSEISEEQTSLAKTMLLEKLAILLTGAKKHGNESLQKYCVEMIEHWSTDLNHYAVEQ